MSVRNSRSVVLVIAVALLAVSAQPVTAASANLAVADQHSTNADFNNARELTNVQVTDDTVRFGRSGAVFDDFEDGDVSDWSSGSDLSASSTRSWEGTNSGKLVGVSKPRLSITQDSYSELSTSMYATSDFSGSPGIRLNDGSGTNLIVVQIDDGAKAGDAGSIVYFDGAWRDTGIQVSSDTWYQITLESIDYSSGVYDIRVEDKSGNVIGTFNNANFRNSGSNLASVDLWAESDSIEVYYDYLISGAPASDTAVYKSANLSADKAEEAAINLTKLRNVSATVQVVDAGTGKILNETTFTSAGNHTLNLGAQDSSDLFVNLTFNKTGTDPLGVLADESILFDPGAPSGTLKSPGDGAELTKSSVDFSIGVSDADFGTAQGDSVEAMLYVDGEVAGSQTVSSNQTVTISDTVSGGGNHTYYWELSDSYGESTTTATRTIKTPTEISLFNETNSSELLDNTTFDVTMYFENGSGPPLVEERTVSDGTVNLSGLPATESFIISVQGDGWVNRRILVPSIYESEKIYMLSENEQTVPVVFELEDFTGQFPQPNTTLLVQRGINGTYQTVLGDEFGATGQFPATLATGSRHRFVLLNTNTGQRRVAGTYTPLAGGQQTISVSPDGGIDVLGIEPTVDWIPGTVLIPATDNATIGARLTNRTVDIDSWNVTAVHAPESGSNTTLWTYSATTNGGRQVTTENLSGLSGNLRIDVSYTLTSGISQTQSRLLTLQEQSDAFSYSLLGQLDSAPAGLLPAGDVDATTTAIALMLSVFGMAVVATSTGTTSELTAGTGVLILGGFSIIGWVGYPLVTVAGVAWIGLTAIRRGVI